MIIGAPYVNTISQIFFVNHKYMSNSMGNMGGFVLENLPTF